MLLLCHYEVSPLKYRTCDSKSITLPVIAMLFLNSVDSQLYKIIQKSCQTLHLYMFEVCLCLLALLLCKSFFPSLYVALANMGGWGAP